tara:strand:+ start:285 stop:860 length:576 start_codon:yes stop_codon:yes gene_type:complete
MKVISGKSIFASLIVILVMSFIINNLLNKNSTLKREVLNKNFPTKQEKILGIKIRQENKNGDKFLIIAESLQEIVSDKNKVILENSTTIINQKGVFTNISSGYAVISNNYDNFNFSDNVKVTKKLRKFTLKTETLIGTFKDGNFYTNDEVDIVSGNTTIKGKGLDVKKNGEYIKIRGKAILKMLLSKKNAY